MIRSSNWSFVGGRPKSSFILVLFPFLLALPQSHHACAMGTNRRRVAGQDALSVTHTHTHTHTVGERMDDK